MNQETKDTEELIQTITALIKNRRLNEVREHLVAVPAPDIKDLLLNLEKTERVLLFRILPRIVSSEVFSHLDAADKDSLLRELSDEETRHLLADLSPDDRTDLLEDIPGEAIQRLLNLLNPEDLKQARQLLGYPEESVGRLMTPDYIAVRQSWTIGRALEHMRIKGKDSETINMIYVVDSSWKLLDELELRRFILAEPDKMVIDIMDFSFVSISVYEDREKAVQMMQHYDLVALPVIDSDGILLGIVTIDDVMDVAEEEITEDFQKTAAIEPLGTTYRESSIWSLYRKRIIWLLALFGVNLASAGVIAVYEETIASAIALAFFIPLIMASGGNVGTQSSTLIVRALGTGDIQLNQWLSSLMREVATGLLIGLTLGIAGGTLGIFKGGIEISLIISCTLVSIVLVTNIIGAFIPFVLTKIGIDPAVASSPLITSISDVTCLILYFAIASFILGVAG